MGRHPARRDDLSKLSFRSCRIDRYQQLRLKTNDLTVYGGKYLPRKGFG
jgi:hypothetical protein